MGDLPTVSMERVTTVRALSDNYMYLIVDPATKQAAVVDPVEPEKLISAAKAQGATITTVLCTHSHWDHAGGNAKIKDLVPGIKIFGGRGDDAEAVDEEVGQGDSFTVGELQVDVLFTPCHTPGHVCYIVDGTDVFTGDTLFVGGCGNFNAGTPAMMAEAFNKLGQLPPTTRAWVGHEYTVANLSYASFVEPNNSALLDKLAWAKETVAAGGITVPTTIGDEHEISPFMRAVFGVESVTAHCGTTDPVQAIKFVRQEKSSNSWKK